MKKRYIFLLSSLVSIILITYFMESKYNDDFIVDIKEEIVVMHNERDSVFLIAEEVISDISERKKSDSSKINELDYLVKNKQVTIEQQTKELNDLTLKSKELKKLVEEEKEKVKEMYEVITIEKINSEKLKSESLDSLKELNKKYELLKKENTKLKELISSLKEEVLKLNYVKDSLSITNNRRGSNRKVN